MSKTPPPFVESFHWAGWEVWSAWDHPRQRRWQEWLECNRSALFNPPQLLKEDHRSRVAIFTDADGLKWVAKRFLLQESWWWFQLTSICFHSLGELAFLNTYYLYRDGFLTPIPSLLLQRKGRLRVLASLLVYSYLEGYPVTIRDEGSIVKLLYRLHQSNWICRDPHPGNFLKVPDGLAILDPVRFLRTRSPYLKAYDLVLLSHDLPHAFPLYSQYDPIGNWFQLARIGHKGVQGYRMVKHTIQRLLGYSPEGR